MNGDLGEQPLAELVREISQKVLSGTLRLQHERGKAAVYFADGEVIYAASNLRELRVAEYLMKQGLVSAKQLSKLGKRSDMSLVSKLCADGVIDRAAVEPLIARQVADILRVALLWSNGKWEFDSRSHLGDSVRVRLDTPGLLLQTARKMELKFVASRFPSTDELISPAVGSPNFNSLLPAEGFVLSRVDGATRLGELIAVSGQRALDATRTIYGLALGGFLERERWPTALRIKYAKATDSAVRAAEEASLPAAVQSESSAQAELDDLHNFLARLGSATSHYDVLNVAAAASVDEIKAKYYSLARRYHPDRFHLRASTELHARIESAFARIAQAYETLTNSSRRSGYDAKLAALERSKQFAHSAPKASRDPERAASRDKDDAANLADSDLERAEDNFQEGYSALQQGQIKLAIPNLAAAARIIPEEPRYRAYYGRALALVKETRRLAETELQAAVRLDPANSSYRVMLAELYCDLGFFKRAEGELERALSSDPNNPAAHKLMRKLEANRTTK